jgi:hypothetical protein
VGGDLAGGQTLGGQRNDHLINPGQPPLPLAHDLRLEAAVPVPWHADLHRAEVGDDGLGAGTVAAVARLASTALVLVVAEMVGDFAFQRGLQHQPGQPAEEPVLPDQFHARGAGLVDQPGHQLPIRLLVLGLLGVLARHAGVLQVGLRRCLDHSTHQVRSP